MDPPTADSERDPTECVLDLAFRRKPLDKVSELPVNHSAEPPFFSYATEQSLRHGHVALGAEHLIVH